MDGGQLLLLQHLRRYVADGNDQVVRFIASDHGSRVHMEKLVIGRFKGGAAGLARGQCRVERTIIGSQDFWATQRRVEVFTDHIIAASPLLQPLVSP